jgi:hypothetical protein
LTEESGGFWFFLRDNLEIFAKTIDGCANNDAFWIFLAGLTDLDVHVLILDTWTGSVRDFPSILGQPFVPRQDILAFETCGQISPGLNLSPLLSRQSLTSRGILEREGGIGAEGPDCEPDGRTLCLNGGRFRARLNWQSFSGSSGFGETGPYFDDSGLFWFFTPQNLEVAVKVIDACDFNNRFWVYATGLTNVAVTLTVDDLVSGAIWQRSTSLGTPFGPFLDSDAIASCE